MLNALRAWLDHTRPKVLPSAPLGKTLRCLHNQWDALVRFCDDGRYGIDTNPVENAIQPFCLGRRNWLFSDTVAGANASARLYSLIETAKANALEPYAYLRHVFTELPKAQSLAEVEALLPTRLDPDILTRHSPQGPINPRQSRRSRGAYDRATPRPPPSRPSPSPTGCRPWFPPPGMRATRAPPPLRRRRGGWWRCASAG